MTRRQRAAPTPPASYLRSTPVSSPRLPCLSPRHPSLLFSSSLPCLFPKAPIFGLFLKSPLPLSPRLPCPFPKAPILVLFPKAATATPRCTAACVCHAAAPAATRSAAFTRPMGGADSSIAAVRSAAKATGMRPLGIPLSTHSSHHTSVPRPPSAAAPPFHFLSKRRDLCMLHSSRQPIASTRLPPPTSLHLAAAARALFPWTSPVCARA
eukprot:363493-Chlamydomonas_euryale.AAC.4